MSATPPYFGDAAPNYSARVSYPLRLFAEIAERFLPERQGRLLDLAAGTGRLATGFSPYFEECLLVDASPEMLASARRRKYAADCQIAFLCTKVEDLQPELGPFDAVSIGRALHHLPHRPTLRLLEGITTSGGLIFICEAGTFPDARNPWHRAYGTARRRFRGEARDVGDTDPRAFFRDSPFEEVDLIALHWNREVTIDDLVKRAFSYSTTSRDALDEQVAAEMEAEIRRVLRPFAEEGTITETAFSYALVLRRD